MYSYPGIPKNVTNAVLPVSKEGFCSSPSLGGSCTDDLRLGSSRTNSGDLPEKPGFSNASQRRSVLQHPSFPGSRPLEPQVTKRAALLEVR